ncbi:MAG: O-antigen ligase family protein [Candidatus Omnitrophica bacterium]|nr:O-antigen ligase family protein [Candidatus Omnitrophota bacterium]
MVDKNKIISALNILIEWALYILIFSLPFSKTAIEVCAIIAISSWILKRVFMGKSGLRLPQTGLNRPMLAFYLIGFLSIFWSTHIDISISAFIRKLTEYIFLYFIVFEAVSERRVVRNIIRAIALSAFIVCVDVIYQKITGFDFIRRYTMYGLDRISVDGKWQKFTGFGSIEGEILYNKWRVTGPFKFPNGLSIWISVVLFPFMGIALFFKKNLKLKAISAILAILLIYCLLLTYTRAAQISCIAGLILMLLLIGGKTSRITLTLLLVGIVILTLLIFMDPAGFQQKLAGDGSIQHRIRIWTAGTRMFAEKPLTGQGLNTFMANYERFKVPKKSERGLWYAHNCYLQIAAETGIFGLLSFLWLIIKMAIESIKSLRLIRDDFLRYAFLGLFCGISVFLLHSSFDVSLYSLQLAVLFYFSLGLLMGIKSIGLNQNG